MAKGPNDFQDPKVSDTKSSGGMGKWIGIAVAVLLALLLLGWLIGAFDDDDVETSTVPIEGDTVILTEPVEDAAAAETFTVPLGDETPIGTDPVEDDAVVVTE